MSSDTKEPFRTSSDSRQTTVDERLESAARRAAEGGLRREHQIKSLESKLANELGNSRAIHNLLVEALGSLDSNRQRVDRALNRHIPHIYQELKESMESLLHLDEKLPEIRSQVQTIRAVYDSGRVTAREVTNELEWKQAPVQEKCRRIILTRSSPVSSFEVALVRLAFCLVFTIFIWQLGGALEGAYRAYRHRLVWGDKLMS